MQLSELLGLEVRDETGRRLGTVVDVRLTVEGNLDERPSAPEVFGILVSPRTRSSYLGYERSDARRPAVLAALLRWRHRGTFLVLWGDIAKIDEDAVCLRADVERYSPALRDDD